VQQTMMGWIYELKGKFVPSTNCRKELVFHDKKSTHGLESNQMQTTRRGCFCWKKPEAIGRAEMT
jgi:hypothetical protein